MLIPFVTTSTTLSLIGLISLRFGPIVAEEPASLKVWHDAQFPFSKKIILPKLNIWSDFAGKKNKHENKQKIK